MSLDSDLKENVVAGSIDRLWRVMGIASVWLLAASVPACADSEGKVKGWLDQQAQRLIKSEAAVGLAIGVIDGDRTYVYGYGVTADDSRRVPDGDTVFEIGSITKVFTGVLLADMVRRKEVDLDEPVVKLLPRGVSVPRSGDRQITLLDLATHSSGLPKLPGNFAPHDPNDPYADYTDAMLYHFLAGCALAHQPGSGYLYSNVGVGLLGLALARRAAMSYEDLVKTRICKPLGLDSTTITLTAQLRSRMAVGHNLDGDVTPDWEFAALAGAGGLRSTVNDLLRLLQASVQTGDGPLAGALTRAQISLRPTDGNGTVGLCWHIFGDGMVRWHNGGTGGFRSFMAMDREKRHAVVVLSNSR